MVDAISDQRWKDAQGFELREWQHNQEIVTQQEWEEAQRKLGTLFKEIASELQLDKTSKILDVGCGPTVPARLLGTGKITGIEPLAKKLGLTGKGKIASNVEVIDGMAEEMPFEDGMFDFVVCRNVIDHTQNPYAITHEVHRVLKDDGVFLLICYIYSPFIAFIKNLSEKIRFMNNVGHPFTFTDGSLEDLVIDNFEILHRYTIHTGQHSTDYGKVAIEEDHSMVNHILIWFNKYVFRYSWFVKEYGFLARKI